MAEALAQQLRVDPRQSRQRLRIQANRLCATFLLEDRTGLVQDNLLILLINQGAAREGAMRDDDREFQKHWKKLAEGISKEPDRRKAVVLTQELLDMLDEYTHKSSHLERERYKKSA